MADLAAVKGEIKQWERAFRAEHGRDPSKDDMKAAPGMQDRYKLYRQLSKGQPRNPFSPVKKKGAAASSLSSRAYLLLDDNHVVPNPFSTPPRSKHRQSRPKRDRSSSPEDGDDVDAFFPPIRPLPAPADTPATRARKRLRGEHVPPSPDKPARTRSFARVQSDAAPRSLFFATAQPAEDDDALAESPAKPAPKNFTPLFDETPPEKAKLVRSMTMPAGGLFARAPPRASVRDDLDIGPTPSALRRAQPNGTSSSPASAAAEPTKTLRRTATLPATASSQPVANGKKRALDSLAEDAEEEGEHESVPVASSSNTQPAARQPFAGMALLPPSPPPAKTSWEPRKAKPKAGPSSNSRYSKKPRLGEHKDDEDPSDDAEADGMQTREVQWRSHGPLALDGTKDEDVLDDWERDMIFRRARTAAPQPADAADGDEPRVRVEVASDMLSVLSLAQSPVKTRRREDDIVRDLLLPTGASWVGGRGEDVFAAGEEEEEREEEDDDDWADEGLRWDEGEL